MRNKAKLSWMFGVAVSSVVSSAAFAEPTADDLTRIEAETTVLKAQAKKLDVKAQIVTRQAEIASKNVEIERLTAPSAYGDPTIRAIEGVGKSMHATLQLDNGSSAEVKEGDVLPNGMKILTIQKNGVVVETRKKKRVRLAYAAAPTASMAMPMAAGPAGLPPLPLPSVPAKGR